jgi:hypothetical protein
MGPRSGVKSAMLSDTYVMRSQIEDLHLVRVAVLDALHVEADDPLQPGPEEAIESVPVLVQGFHVLKLNVKWNKMSFFITSAININSQKQNPLQHQKQLKQF